MSRGLLPREIRERIDAGLPDIMPMKSVILGMPPDMFATRFGPSDLTPVAIICLSDWCDTMVATRIALFEYYAHGAYYRDHVIPANPFTATFFERYFLDDAALRLYSAGE